MAFDFNPITGQLDLVGGGSSYIDGDVEYHADLPVTVGTPAVNSAFLVRKGQGLYFLTRKPAGIWVRELNNGNLDDWKYAGTFSDIYRDANFRIINDADTSKQLAFSLSGLTTGTTSTLTVPASGTIARTQDFAAPPAIGNTTRNTGAFTTLSATGQATFSDQITGANATATPPTTTTAAKGLQFALLGGSTGNTAAIYGSHGGTSTLGIGIANSSAGSITQVAAFTSSGLSVNGGTVTASAPVLDLAQTWNNSGVTFTGLAATITNTQSAAGSLAARFTVGSTNVFEVDARGFTTLRKVATTTDFVNMFIVRRGTTEVFAVRDDGATNALAFSCPAGGAGHASMNADGYAVRSTGSFRISSDTAAFSPDVFLRRDAAGVFAQYNGTNAQEYRLYGTFTSSTNYQRMTVKSVKQTLSPLSGASATTTGTFIPDGAVVVGVTTRVTTAITGAAGYQVGDGTDADRWGDINATALNTTSDNANWTAGTVECFTAGGNVTLTANGSDFTAGAIEICVFYLAGQAD